MKKLNNLTTLIAILIAIWVLSFYRTTVADVLIRTLGGYTNQENVTVIDSTFTRGKIDTLAVFNHFVRTKGITLNPKPIIEYKYKYIDPVIDKEVELDSIKKFTVKIKDSLIDGNLTVINKFNGDLAYTDLDYKPLFPKFIRRTDTLRITKTNTITLSNDKDRIGIGVGANNLQFLSILGSYTTKKDWQFIYEYGRKVNIDLTQTPTQLHSIKIIKNF